jgi:hypothetical protein
LLHRLSVASVRNDDRFHQNSGPSVNDRHLMGNGGRARSTDAGDRTSLRFEKMSDAALGTRAAIENASNKRGT